MAGFHMTSWLFFLLLLSFLGCESTSVSSLPTLHPPGLERPLPLDSLRSISLDRLQNMVVLHRDSTRSLRSWDAKKKSIVADPAGRC